VKYQIDMDWIAGIYGTAFSFDFGQRITALLLPRSRFMLLAVFFLSGEMTATLLGKT